MEAEADILAEGLMDGEALTPEQVTSTAIPPISVGVVVLMSTLVSESILHSVSWSALMPAGWVRTEYPLPAVIAIPPAPKANAPKVALLGSAKAPRVTVRDVPEPLESELILLWTIAPLPFVPESLAPVASSIDHRTSVWV